MIGSGALLVGISRAMVPRSSQFRARHLADTGTPFGVRAATWHQAARRYTLAKMSTQASREIQTFPNPNPGRDFEIQCVCPEFTNVCPMTGQPDFATITITYVPDQRCIELKSLKLYLWTYRDEGGFHEAVTNQIADDLIAALDPRRITVVGAFNVRGGITTTVTVTHHKG
jgi:7-cyano-7-deazaguanine reductase